MSFIYDLRVKLFIFFHDGPLDGGHTPEAPRIMKVLPVHGGGGAPHRHGGVHGAMMLDERFHHRDEELEIKDYITSHFYELHVMFIPFLACPDCAVVFIRANPHIKYQVVVFIHV